MKKETLLSLGFFLISLASVFTVTEITTVSIGNTFLWWLSYAYFIILLIVLLVKNTSIKSIRLNGGTPILYLLLWFLICFVRGVFVADNYWQWKNLVTVGFTFLIPMIAFLSLYPNFFSLSMKKWLRYSLPFFFIIYFVFTDDGDGAGRYLAPISLLTLFFPLVSYKYKMILIGVSTYVILDNIDARSNVIKFVVPILLSSLLYFRFYAFRSILKSIYIVSIFLPFFLFFLAIFNIFNIFKFDEYINIDDSKTNYQRNGKEVNLTADSRTFLYEEVLSSAEKYDYVLFGRTPARGNDSQSFGEANYELGIKNIERFANEVAILNIFTWTGLVGVLLYFWVFLKGSYLAIYKSRNQYARLLGIYLCFRWCYNWVEDFTNFDLFYITLWMVIGLCYSKQFRFMTNEEVKLWAKKMIYFNFKKSTI